MSSTTVSTGATVKDDPGGYLHALILDTEFDEGRGQHGENMHDGCKLAADVFARISPEDYGPLLLSVLQEQAPEVVDDFLDYADEAEAADEPSEPVSRCLHEIQAAEQEFSDRLWYHVSLELNGTSEDVRAKGESDDITAGMLASRERIERKYGRENLDLSNPYDLGMISGKLSALRWVFGNGWDNLDT